MNNEDRMGVLFRGRCGAWVLEEPNGDIHDLPATEAAKMYWDYYDMDELYIRDPEPEDGMTCIHGEPILDDYGSMFTCSMCCEEFLAQQLAVCQFRDGKTTKDVFMYINGFIDSPFTPEKIVSLVDHVFTHLDDYDPVL